jgi:hypothetical protein
MRKIQILGLALFAVFAFSVVVASASAEVALWLVEEKDITEAEGPLAVHSEGELLLTDLNTLFGVATVDCSGFLVGTVGPNQFDLIESILNLSFELIEELPGLGLLCLGLGECLEEEDAEVRPEHLPWLTELELMEVGGVVLFLNKILADGNGEPAYESICLDLFGFSHEDLCEGATSMKIENMVLPEFTLGIFNEAESEKGTCTLGGAESGDIEGEGSILLTGVEEGKMLTVSEP